MSKAHLSPCPSCSRHVRVSESSCPHCGMATTEEFRSRPAPRAPGKRLNRAALYAVGVGAIAVTAACSSGDSTSTDSDAAVTGDAAVEEDAPRAVAMYGAPADASPYLDTGAEDAGEDGSNVVALYGAPADSGVDDSGTDSSGVAPLYGGAPIDSGKT